MNSCCLVATDCVTCVCPFQILSIIGQEDLPVRKSWRLNERHYGDLTGLNKAETAAKHGEAQVKVWRRDFNIPPPAITPENPYYEAIMNDPRYRTNKWNVGRLSLWNLWSVTFVGTKRLTPIHWNRKWLPGH